MVFGLRTYNAISELNPKVRLRCNQPPKIFKGFLDGGLKYSLHALCTWRDKQSGFKYVNCSFRLFVYHPLLVEFMNIHEPILTTFFFQMVDLLNNMFKSSSPLSNSLSFWIWGIFHVFFCRPTKSCRAEAPTLSNLMCGMTAWPASQVLTKSGCP